MDWYTTEIIDGLTKLMSLSLDRTPAADLVQITAATWIDATTSGRRWDQERDTPRIRAAFSTLARTREQWPAPRHFLDAMPAPPNPPAIEKQFKPASPESVAKARAELNEWLASMEGRGVADATPDRKTAAAGGDA